MNWKQVLAGAVLAGVLTGCATASLSAAGSRVTPVAQAPGPECKNLGTVVGAGGGAFGGAYISNDQLVQFAMNDAMNKAAQRGATHLQPMAPALGDADGTTSTATLMAIAYRCPGAGGEEIAALAAQPAEKSYLTDCPPKHYESTRERAIRCKAEAKQKEAKAQQTETQQSQQ
jgi:hypothetical protein